MNAHRASLKKNVGKTTAGEYMGKESLFSEIFNRHNEIVHIDREEENAAVERFQQTGDKDILDQVYKDRIPTLMNWSLRYYYPGLELSIDDFMEELSIVFVKAASKYDRSKGSFNTVLYTYLTNRIKNMKNSTHAKKRRPENYDGPLNGILLSLDHVYSHDKGGNETTLQDVLVQTESGEEDSSAKAIHFKETIKFLSNDNPILNDIFIKIGEGNTLSSIIKESKVKRGSVFLSETEIDSVESEGECAVKEILCDVEQLEGDFSIIDFDMIDEERLDYAVEYKRTKESDLINKTIKDLRKNKEYYIDKIKGS
jgi:hypothetical protein